MSEKGYIPLLVIFGLLILLGSIVFSGYYLSERTQLFSQASTGTVRDVISSVKKSATDSGKQAVIVSKPSGWNDFSDSGCQVTISLPANWKGNSRNAGRFCEITFKDNDSNVKQNISIKTPRDTRNAAILLARLQSKGLPETQELILNDGMAYLFSSDIADVTILRFLIKKDNLYLDGSYRYTGGKEEARNFLSQIIKTIRFTGEKDYYKGTFTPEVKLSPLSTDLLDKVALFRANSGLNSNYLTSPITKIPTVKWKEAHYYLPTRSLFDFQPLVVGNTIFSKYYALSSCNSDLAGINVQTRALTYLFSSGPAGDKCKSPDAIQIHKGKMLTYDNYSMSLVDILTNTPIWSISINSIKDYPVVDGGMIYTTSTNSGSTYGDFQVNALEFDTGKTVWSGTISKAYTYKPQVVVSENNVLVLTHHLGDYVKTAVEDNNLTQSLDGMFLVPTAYLFDRVTGEQKKLDSFGRVDTPSIGWNTVGDPIYANGTFYFRAGTGLFAIDGTSGAIVGSVLMKSDLGAIEDYISLSAVDGMVYIGGFGNNLIGSNANLSEQIWTVDLESPMDVTPIIAGDYLYTATKTDLIAFNRLTGEEIWRYKLERPLMSDLVIDNEVLYFRDNEFIYALH